MKLIYQLLLICILLLSSCKQEDKHNKVTTEDNRTQIELKTTKGTMVVELYNKTPKHRDNFIKLAKDSTLNGTLFHRVIENFMVQGGDIESITAMPGDTLGNGDLPYKVDAEFHSKLFHKKGALGAARDGNLARASSSTQFYIVQGVIQNDSLLAHNEKRINGWLQEHYFNTDTINATLFNALEAAKVANNVDAIATLKDSIKELTAQYKYNAYTIPEDQREVYKTIGGTPHLDQNYTVFGEVIHGLQTIDSIASVNTNALDRPLEDVKLISIKILQND